MGLDQAVRRLSPESFALIQKWEAGDHEDPYPEVEEEQMWTGRKENHIQCYIEGEVGEVENCAYLPLQREHIERLVERLRQVKYDHDLAGSLLPTQAGFFFGGTDYDEWYFNDVDEELMEFQKILESWDDSSVYVYWAWW